MKKLRVPKELKKALIEKNLSFRAWCRKYGFDKTTTLYLLNGHLKDLSNAPKSQKILETLKKDFPEIFKKEETIK